MPARLQSRRPCDPLRLRPRGACPGSSRSAAPWAPLHADRAAMCQPFERSAGTDYKNWTVAIQSSRNSRRTRRYAPPVRRDSNAGRRALERSALSPGLVGRVAGATRGSGALDLREHRREWDCPNIPRQRVALLACVYDVDSAEPKVDQRDSHRRSEARRG